MSKRDELDQLLKKKHVTQEEAFAFYDALEPAELSMFHGKWKGKEMTTGHPLDGMLRAANWYGKYFKDPENAYPLLFEQGNGKLFIGEPKRLPLKQFERVNRKIISIVFKLVTPFIKTKNSSARLREIRYRNKVTTAMFYDSIPFIDIFAKVDENTLLGVSDLRWDHDMGYFFVIERVKGDTI